MLNLTKFAVRKPVTIIMCLLTIAYFGIQSLLGTKVELTPEMEFPMLVVSTVYAGASPDDIKDLIATKEEDAVSSLDDVKNVYSFSQDNVAIVLVEYNYGTNIDTAYINLKKAIDGIKGDLPDDANEPNIMEMDMNSQPVITLAVGGQVDGNLYTYVENNIKPELEKLGSVGEVSLAGGQKEYISIKLDPEKVAQYGLSMSRIAQFVGAADFTIPAGDVNVGKQNLSVSVGNDFDNTEALKNVAIPLANGDVIHLSDVATVSNALEDADSIGRYNGQDIVSVSIKKQQSSTAIDVSKDVLKQVSVLEKTYPGLTFTVVNDSSDMITESITNVFQTMIMAVILSMIILWLFYGDIRASVIVGTSIPISIMLTLIAMSLMGFSLNVISLTSLVLGVGMMVDNSIVVLESCFRSTKGKGIVGYREAALEGSGIVLQSIIGSTVTTCVVFLPLALLQGLTGQMFKPLGFTIIFCMVASLISAMTIVPLCYCFYRPQEKEESPVGALIRAMQNGYRSIMKVLLKKKKTVLFTSVALLVAAFWMASQLRMELMVSDDTGEISVSIETRPGLTLEEEDKIYEQVEKIVTADEDLDSYMLTSGGSGMSAMTSSGATLTAYLKDDRKRETNEVIKEWKPLLNQITGANISMDIASSSTMTSSTSGIEYILQGTQYDELKSASDQITKELLARPEVSKVHSTLENAAPVVKLNIDAVKANAENITPLQIAGTVSSMLGGKEATTLNVDGDDVSVMVEYPEDEYDTIDKLKGIVLTGNAGGSVALADVADIVFQDSPNTITRKDKQYQVTITGDVPTDDARQIDAIENKLYNEVVSKHLTPTITRGLNSQDESMKEEFGNLGMAILTAVFLIFVVMAAQFESPKFSLMVMTTIPFSLIGSFGLLYLADCPISMVSLLGFLMLVGTVVNNGILYVDTVNQYRSKMDRDTALIEAGATRLRPILMTTLTTIVSMIPMALAYGDSGKSMQGLALVDVGGLVASTVLALLMLPIYYEVMSLKKKPEPHYD